MKYLFLTTLIFLLSPVAHAEPECFDFNVSKNSTELLTVRISITKEKKKVSAVVTGATADKKISNDNFDCKESGKITCEQLNGAGDFTLELGNEAVLKFSYVNLAIGGNGPNAAKPNGDITEEFAFLDKSPAASDEEEDADHLHEVTLKGSKVSCDAKM